MNVENREKAVSIFNNILNKTGKDKIFILILAGVLMMVIAMPTKDEETTGLSTQSTLLSSDADEYDMSLGEELEQMLSETAGVGEVSVMLKTNDDREVTGVMVVCEGGDDSGIVAYITDAINGLLGVPVHKIKVMKMSQ